MDNNQHLKDKPATNAAAEEILSDKQLDSVTGGTGGGTGPGDTDSGTGTGDNYDYREEICIDIPYIRYAGLTGPG